MSLSKARRTDAEIKVPAHHTVEKSNFRCSCTFSEGSPDVTIPSRSLFFDKIFFGIAESTCDSPSLHVFLWVIFGHHFGVLAALQKTSVPPRACKYWRYVAFKRTSFFLSFLRLLPNTIKFFKKQLWWFHSRSFKGSFSQSPKVHCEKPHAKQMPFNIFFDFFLFSTLILTFFWNATPITTQFFPAVRPPIVFTVASRTRFF